jgi:uncharacterized protein YkwD
MRTFTTYYRQMLICKTILILGLLLFTACNEKPVTAKDQTTTQASPQNLSKTNWMKAMMDGDRKLIEAGIEQGLSPDTKNQHGDSAFMWAAYRGRLDWVKTMVEQGATVDYQGTYGKTAMHLAAERGHFEIVEALLDSGSDPYIVDRKSRTPLELAVEFQKFKVVQAMLKHEIDPNKQGNGPLLAAVRINSKDAVRWLVLAGANPIEVSETGLSPLKRAVQLGYEGLFAQTELEAIHPDLPKLIKAEYRSVIVNASERPKLDLEKLAQQIHKRINAIREEHGLGKLQYDEKLASVALKHSQDMSQRNFFEHVNPDGADPTDRAKQQNYQTRRKIGNFQFKDGIAENIYKTFLFGEYSVEIRNGTQYITRTWRSAQDLVDMAVDGWMNSPGHRANILNREVDREGIGIAVGPDDGIYFTQNMF